MLAAICVLLVYQNHLACAVSIPYTQLTIQFTSNYFAVDEVNEFYFFNLRKDITEQVTCRSQHQYLLVDLYSGCCSVLQETDMDKLKNLNNSISKNVNIFYVCFAPIQHKFFYKNKQNNGTTVISDVQSVVWLTYYTSQLPFDPRCGQN